MAFGLVHRNVGVANQYVQIGAVIRKQADTDTAGEEQLVTGDHERRFKHRHQLLCHHRRAMLAVDILQQQDKFIATEPG